MSRMENAVHAKLVRDTDPTAAYADATHLYRSKLKLGVLARDKKRPIVCANRNCVNFRYFR